MNGNQERSFFDPQELDYQESDVRQYLRNIPKRRLEEIKKNFIQAGGTANVDYRTDQPHPRIKSDLLQAEVIPSLAVGNENFSFRGEPRFNLVRQHVDYPEEWGGEQSGGSRGFDYRGGDYTARMPNLGLLWNQRTGAPDSFGFEAPMLGGLLSGQMTPEQKAWMLNFTRQF